MELRLSNKTLMNSLTFIHSDRDILIWLMTSDITSCWNKQETKHQQRGRQKEKMAGCRFPITTITDPQVQKRQIITRTTKDLRHKHTNLTAAPDESLSLTAGIYLTSEGFLLEKEKRWRNTSVQTKAASPHWTISVYLDLYGLKSDQISVKTDSDTLLKIREKKNTFSLFQLVAKATVLVLVLK